MSDINKSITDSGIGYAQKYRIKINLINGNSLKNKHCNGYYLYKLLWCVFKL